MALSSETQMTQQGQAIRMNYMAINSLAQIFESNIGPNGTYKMLITPSGQMKVTKDGATLSKEISFTHPTAVVVNRQISSLAQEVGDGTSSFVVLLSKIFNSAFKYFMDGISIYQIIESIEDAKKDLINVLRGEVKPLTEDVLKKLLFISLNTKIEKEMAEKLTDIVIDALENIKGNRFFDTNMIEIMKMPGDNEVKLINGLVLDHGNRHYAMPTKLENCAIFITNMSLEYERPEVHSGFYYASVEERKKIVENERNFIIQRAVAIAEMGKQLQNEGKSLIVISERGIDPYSLEILANANILALRRAKRRNLERLINMCGGTIISRMEEIKVENLGFCRKAYVKDDGDEKFTFIEGTPFKNSCTILIKGDNPLEMDKIHNAIKSSFKSLTLAIKDKVYLEGGYKIYYKLIQVMTQRLKEKKNSIGYKILKEAYEEMLKILIKNTNQNCEETLSLLERDEYVYEEIPENIAVVSSVLMNSCVSAMNLLLIDEIIKAGKPIREEGKKE